MHSAFLSLENCSVGHTWFSCWTKTSTWFYFWSWAMISQQWQQDSPTGLPITTWEDVWCFKEDEEHVIWKGLCSPESHYNNSVLNNRLWFEEILLLSAWHNGKSNQPPLGQNALSIHSEAERTTSQKTFSLGTENWYQCLAQPSTLFVRPSVDNGWVCFPFIPFSVHSYFD